MNTLFDWPGEFVQINNSRVASEIGLRGAWLRKQQEALPRTNCKKETRRIESVQKGLLAARLLANLKGHLERNASEQKLSSAQRAHFTPFLRELWRFSKEL